MRGIDPFPRVHDPERERDGVTSEQQASDKFGLG